MFLKSVMERNQPLVRLGIEWQQAGVILPDTYLLDYDTIVENARRIKQAGDASGVQNFFMLKQIGRNPMIAQALAEMGYVGAVCVDFREALTMVENNVPIGNVGHLVQIPRAALKKILSAKPKIVTVYSLEKAQEISRVCTELGLHQKLMLRVLGENDMLYSGQYGGFTLAELEQTVHAIENMPGVEVGGVCSFPCFLYDEAAGDILPTPNLSTVQTAARMLTAWGYKDLMRNTPSATCVHSIPKIAAAGGTHGEPGHGLTGTTPYHAAHPDAEERPGYLYVSEVSHGRTREVALPHVVFHNGIDGGQSRILLDGHSRGLEAVFGLFRACAACKCSGDSHGPHGLSGCDHKAAARELFHGKLSFSSKKLKRLYHFRRQKYFIQYFVFLFQKKHLHILMQMLFLFSHST